MYFYDFECNGMIFGAYLKYDKQEKLLHHYETNFILIFTIECMSLSSCPLA